MSHSAAAILIALIPPISWGVMWFFITKASRVMEAFRTQFLFQLAGIPMLLLIAPFISRPAVTSDAWLIVALGVFETFVLTLFFYALQVGTLAIVSPISEANVLIPVCLGIFFLHESAGLLKLLGIAGILAGVILLGLRLSDFAGTKKIALYRGVPAALLSAVGAGLYGFFVSISSKLNGWYYTTIGIRAMIALTILVIFLFQKKNLAGIFSRVPWHWVIPAALLDVIGFSAFNFALTRYEVSYVTVMAAAMPVVSVTLAAALLKERLRPYQIAGFALVVLGIASLNLK